MRPGKPDWWRTEPPAKFTSLVLLVLGCSLLAALAGVVGEMGTFTYAGEKSQRFEHAHTCSETAVLVSLDRAGLAKALQGAGEPPRGCWKPVVLPWQQRADAMLFDTVRQRVSRTWFRVVYPVSPLWLDDQNVAIFIPRAMGAAWQMRAGGAIVSDNLDDWRMTWNRPIVLTVPQHLVEAGQPLVVDLVTLSVPGIGNAVGSITVGPAPALQLPIALRQYLQATVPQAASAAMLLMGLFFFLFWNARPAESEYLLLAASGVVWSVCNLQFLLPRTDDPALDEWYWTLVHHLPITWLNLLIYRFSMRFSERRVAWLDRCLPWYVIAMTVAALPLWPGSQDRSLMMMAIYTGIGIAYIGTICWMAAVGRSVEMRVIAVTLCLGALAGINDLLLAARSINPERFFLLPITGLLIYAAFLYAVQRRYVAAIRGHEELSDSLARRLADRERSLRANYERLRELERAQELAAERQRLMGEIHDGLGSVLTASLAALQRGASDQDDVAAMLRDCVDELRLVIDSLDPMERDLVAVMAALRFRLGRRVEAAGIRVEWRMEELPPMDWLGAQEVLQLMRVVQEVLANVVKHAQAGTVCISARLHGGEVEIRCVDDGRGFDTAAPHAGRGLASISRRSRELGARLEIASTMPGGTLVSLRLPLVR